MISEIKNLELANSIIINRIAQDERNFYSLDEYTHAALMADRTTFLRESLDLDYDEFVRRYIESFGKVSNPATYAFNGFSISQAEAANYVVYPFSRINLHKTIFSDVFPSLFLSYFNLMKNTERLHQVGTGVGKSFIISIVPFTKDELKELKILRYQDTVELMVLVGDQITRQNTDIEYLLQRVSDLAEEKEFLISEINRLNQAVINTSITTWR